MKRSPEARLRRGPAGDTPPGQTQPGLQLEGGREGPGHSAAQGQGRGGFSAVVSLFLHKKLNILLFTVLLLEHICSI